jgi:hypothetical protein
MSYSKIPQTTQFNTGFLPNSSKDRIKQGLLPQELTGNCISTDTDTARTGAVYNFPVSQLSYGPKDAFPDKCACTRYIHSP